MAFITPVYMRVTEKSDGSPEIKFVWVNRKDEKKFSEHPNTVPEAINEFDRVPTSRAFFITECSVVNGRARAKLNFRPEFLNEWHPTFNACTPFKVGMLLEDGALAWLTPIKPSCALHPKVVMAFVQHVLKAAASFLLFLSHKLDRFDHDSQVEMAAGSVPLAPPVDDKAKPAPVATTMLPGRTTEKSDLQDARPS